MGVAEGRLGEVPRLYSVDLRREHDEHEDAYARALIWAAERFKIGKPDRVLIEAPIPASAMAGHTNANTTAMLFGLWAIMAAVAKARGVTVRRANIQAVRRSFIGHGNLKGDVAKRKTMQVCALLGWDAPNHDAADAGAVWHWGCGQIDPALTPRTEPLFLRAAE
jgi:hypothetical protein